MIRSGNYKKKFSSFFNQIFNFLSLQRLYYAGPGFNPYHFETNPTLCNLIYVTIGSEILNYKFRILTPNLISELPPRSFARYPSIPSTCNPNSMHSCKHTQTIRRYFQASITLYLLRECTRYSERALHILRTPLQK